MGGLDAAFLYGESPQWHMHVASLMIVDPSTTPSGYDFEHLNYAGARVEAQYPMGPLVFGMGLIITVLSYCDSLDFGFMCCPELVPQPELIAEGVALALTELEETAAVRAAATHAAQPGPRSLQW